MDTCQVCGVMFANKKYMFRHMKTHMDKNHWCNVCNKTFTTKPNLLEHQKNAHSLVQQAFIFGDLHNELNQLEDKFLGINSVEKRPLEKRKKMLGRKSMEKISKINLRKEYDYVEDNCAAIEVLPRKPKSRKRLFFNCDDVLDSKRTKTM